MAVSRTPWLGSIVLPAQNTAYQLSARLALHATPPLVSLNVLIAQAIAIQLDISAGAANLYIGPQEVSTTNYGVALVAPQVWPIYSMDSNLINLDHIWLMSDTASTQVNISFITR